MEGLHLIDPGIPDHRWHSVLVFNYGRSGAWIYQLRGRESIQRSRSRDRLAYLPARHCARDVFRFCAKSNGLANERLTRNCQPELFRLPPAQVRATMTVPCPF